MRAVVVDSPGGPEVLRVTEVPDAAAGPGEVLVRVQATAVNRADILQRQGLYPPPAGASEILGLECSGIVIALGEGTQGWARGERVCGLLSGGGYAELVAVPAGQLMRVPESLDLDLAAAVPEVFVTAHDNLAVRGRLTPGESVLVHGGAGGVGTAAIQICRRLGCRVLATAGGPERAERCRELGADEAIDHRSEDFVERCLELTGGRGVDVVLDVMGASYLERNLAILAVDGRLVVIGLQGGIRAEIDLNSVIRRRLTLTGSTLRSRSIEEKALAVSRVVAEVMPAIAGGELRPIVDRVLPLERAADAHRAIEGGEVVGKVVLRVTGSAG